MDNSLTIHLEYTIITTPLPDSIFDGLHEYSRSANAYHPQPNELIQKIAEKHSIAPETILLTCGADEAIRMFALAYGQKTYVFTPTFISYEDIKEFYTDVTYIPSIQSTSYMIDTSHRPDATLIYLVNPNNPFGITSKENVLQLMRNNLHAIVVIDEVYAEFNDVSVIGEVQNHPNLAVIRSFSKAYGMAGNRIGFIVAQEDVYKKVLLKTPWSNVSYLSVGAAVTALKHETYFTSLRQDILEKRDRLVTFFAEKGYNIFPSYINCVVLKLPSEEIGTQFVQHLKASHILVSHGNGHSNIGLDNSFVRIAIGSDDEISTLKKAVAAYDR